MRYFQPAAETRFYAGVDLHARALFLVVIRHSVFRAFVGRAERVDIFSDACSPDGVGIS